MNKILLYLLIFSFTLNIFLIFLSKKKIEKISKVEEISFALALEQLFNEEPKQTIYYCKKDIVYSFIPLKDKSFIVRKFKKDKKFKNCKN